MFAGFFAGLILWLTEAIMGRQIHGAFLLTVIAPLAVFLSAALIGLFVRLFGWKIGLKEWASKFGYVCSPIISLAGFPLIGRPANLYGTYILSLAIKGFAKFSRKGAILRLIAFTIVIIFIAAYLRSLLPQPPAQLPTLD
jgi:hypothetical protein